MDYKMKKLITIAVMGLFIMTAYAQTDNAGSKVFSNYTGYKGLVFVSGQIGNADALKLLKIGIGLKPYYIITIEV
jgi:enamine deaminase RidA (YjgF/YER057c/UK114 family)